MLIVAPRIGVTAPRVVNWPELRIAESIWISSVTELRLTFQNPEGRLPIELARSLVLCFSGHLSISLEGVIVGVSVKSRISNHCLLREIGLIFFIISLAVIRARSSFTNGATSRELVIEQSIHLRR